MILTASTLKPCATRQSEPRPTLWTVGGADGTNVRPESCQFQLIL